MYLPCRAISLQRLVAIMLPHVCSTHHGPGFRMLYLRKHGHNVFVDQLQQSPDLTGRANKQSARLQLQRMKIARGYVKPFNRRAPRQPDHENLASHCSVPICSVHCPFRLSPIQPCSPLTDISRTLSDNQPVLTLPLHHLPPAFDPAPSSLGLRLNESYTTDPVH